MPPKVVERWMRVHHAEKGDLCLWVIQSKLTCEWLLQTSGAQTPADSQKFECLESAQRFGDDYAAGVWNPHDCRQCHCGSWQVDHLVQGDLPITHQ